MVKAYSVSELIETVNIKQEVTKDDIRVRVAAFGDRKLYLMHYVNQTAGDKKRSKSTKIERTGRKRE